MVAMDMDRSGWIHVLFRNKSGGNVDDRLDIIGGEEEGWGD